MSSFSYQHVVLRSKHAGFVGVVFVWLLCAILIYVFAQRTVGPIQNRLYVPWCNAVNDDAIKKSDHSYIILSINCRLIYKCGI